MTPLVFSKFVLAALAGSFLVLFIWLISLTIAVRRLGAMRRKVAEALVEENSVTDMIGKSLDEVERIWARIEKVTMLNKSNRSILTETIRRVGVVRYDAFPDVGGHLSFSAALLDEKGNGLVITSINGRTDGRVYAKQVIDGSSEHTLSDEEQQAIAEALQKVSV